MNILEDQERRQYKRIKKSFIAKFRDKEGWEMVTVRNLGAGGTLFNYNREIPIGSQIDLLINFPFLEDPVSCASKIIRIEKDDTSPILKIAAQFVDIREKDRQEIDNAAENFYSKRPGQIDAILPSF